MLHNTQGSKDLFPWIDIVKQLEEVTNEAMMSKHVSGLKHKNKLSFWTWPDMALQCIITQLQLYLCLYSNLIIWIFFALKLPWLNTSVFISEFSVLISSVLYMGIVWVKKIFTSISIKILKSILC